MQEVADHPRQRTEYLKATNRGNPGDYVTYNMRMEGTGRIQAMILAGLYAAVACAVLCWCGFQAASPGVSPLASVLSHPSGALAVFTPIVLGLVVQLIGRRFWAWPYIYLLVFCQILAGLDMDFADQIYGYTTVLIWILIILAAESVGLVAGRFLHRYVGIAFFFGAGSGLFFSGVGLSQDSQVDSWHAWLLVVSGVLFYVHTGFQLLRFLNDKRTALKYAAVERQAFVNDDTHPAVLTAGPDSTSWRFKPEPTEDIDEVPIAGSENSMIIRTKYVLASPGELLVDTAVRISGNLISEIDPGLEPKDGERVLDLGLAVLTPGLVNAHAHLELEFCAGEIPFTGSFVDWLTEIRNRKQARGGKSTAFPRQSMDDLLAVGCTTVIDHHTFDLDWASVESHGLRHIAMREVFGFNNHEPDHGQLAAMQHRSFAPHAPYTASMELALACHELARSFGQPISYHLAEFAGEIDFIRDGSDPQIVELLRRAGAMDEGFKGTGRSPVRLYAEAGLLHSAYAVHVNYLAPGDLEYLRSFKPVVVYCPRSHAFFKHPDHPLPSLLRAGVPVALGTDSLASNDRLSPLHEAALVRERYPEVSPAELFATVTINGLRPLGFDCLSGKVMPGRIADLAVFNLSADPGSDFAKVFDAVIAQEKAELTMVDGVVRHGSTRASG